MKYKSVLVTGGAGFLGRHLISSLLDEKYFVRCLDRVKPVWLSSNIEFIEGDFTEPHVLAPVIKGMDAIIHLVSTTLPKMSNDCPKYDAISNLAGTIDLLELAVKYRTKRLIFISSGGTVYGEPSVSPVSEAHSSNPLCSYGIIKLTIEKYLRLYHYLYGLKCCSLRLANLYGEHQRVDTGQGAIAVFCQKALREEPICIWGDGTVIRDYLYVKDAVGAIMQALLTEYSGLEINIGSGQGVSLNHIISIIESILGRNVTYSLSPGRLFDIKEVYLDISKARKLLHWAPSTDLRDGIRLMIDWFKTAS